MKTSRGAAAMTFSSLAALGVALVLSVAADGCVENPRYCEASRPCADPTASCVLHQCVPRASDGGTDFAPTDLAGDLAGADFAVADGEAIVDLIGADLAGSCVNAAGCPGATTPVCDATTHLCRACDVGAECPSLVCKDDGSCADPTTVVYADNANGQCVVMLHAGSAADPACEISDAIALAVAAKLSFIRVAGSTVAYKSVVANLSGAYSIVGPGARAMPPATVAGRGGPAVSLAISGRARSTSLTLDGLVIHGDPTSTAAALECSGLSANVPAVRLAVRRVLVSGSGGSGIGAHDCTLLVLDDTVRDNKGAAVSASGHVDMFRAFLLHNGGAGVHLEAPGKAGSGTDYNLANLIVGDNLGGGVEIVDANASGRFGFNTILNNGTVGVACGGVYYTGVGQTASLESSIIWGNQSGAGSQVCDCTLTDVVMNEPNVAGATFMATIPDFVDVPGMDYHLQRMSVLNERYLVDKIRISDAGAIDVAAVPNDIDGTVRPLGLGWDIGAHEVE